MDKKKLRIIFLIADADLTGAPKQLLFLVKRLNPNEFEPVIISPNGYLTEQLDKLGIERYAFDFKRGMFANRKLLKVIKSLVNENTIIHAQGVRAGYFGRAINRRLKLDLIYTEHNWTKDYKLPQNWRRYYQLRQLKKFDNFTSKTVAVSNAVKDFLVENKIVPEERVQVIYNGVEFRKVARRQDRDPIVIGTIASLHKRKGLVYLFEALAKLKKQEKNKLILKVVGSGPQESFLKQHSVTLGVNFDIQWLGNMDDLTEFWEGINVYVQPSLDESFGMAVAEAMGYKIPVVATTAGALPEIVDEAGLLVNPEDSTQLVKAVHNVIHNDTIREDNIEKAYNIARDKFTVKRMVKEYEELYRNYIK